MNASRDNLYKWCLISGLVISLFALNFPFRFVEGLAKRSMPLEISTRRAEIEANDLFQRMDVLGKTLKADGQTNPEGQAVALSDDEKRTATRSLAELQLAYNIKFAEIKTSNAELAREHSLTVAITVIGFILFIVGVSLFVSGIKRWYVKVQCVNDFILQGELDKQVADKQGKK